MTRKLSIFVIFAVTLASMGAASLVEAQQPSRPVIVAVFEMVGPMPEAPEAMTVYKVLPPKVSEEVMKRWMAAFELDGEIIDRERQLVVKDEKRVLEVFKQPGTGYVRFSDNAKLAIEEAATNLPSENEAAKKAEAFLTQNGLLPENASFAGIGYYDFRLADQKGVVTSEGKSGISAAFAVELGELPVLGPGAKASVAFGSNGEIIGAARIWREVAADKEVTIISPEDAIERFKAGWPPEKVDGMPEVTTIVTVTELVMAYWAGPGPIPQMWVEPVYVFRGFHETEGEIGKRRIHEREHFEIVIPAVPEGETKPHSSWGPRPVE